MTLEQFNTVSRKVTHLSYQERCHIANLKFEGNSNHHIAKVLNRAPQTLNNEVKRGTITHIKLQKQKGRFYNQVSHLK